MKQRACVDAEIKSSCYFRHRKCRSTDGSPDGFWGKDTPEQFASIMLLQQAAVDIISVHTYEDDCFFIPKCSCSPAFGPARVNCDGRATLFLAATTAASADKLLYAGEYGNVTYVDVVSRRYLNEVLSIQVMCENTHAQIFHLVFLLK